MKKLRILFSWGQSINRALFGPMFDWQEWFGGFYWLKIEFWFLIWFIEIEITNRPPDPDVLGKEPL
jgi:hypothetical protein